MMVENKFYIQFCNEYIVAFFVISIILVLVSIVRNMKVVACNTFL